MELRPMLEGLELEPKIDMPFRRFYILKRDDMILKVLMNCFNAVKDVFPEYWRSPNNNILWKSTGFGGIIKSLNDLILLGIKDKTLTKDFLCNVLNA